MTFEYNPPAATVTPSYNSSKGGRAGTMRIKGNALGKQSVMSLYSPTEGTPEREPAVIEGYLKLLKQTGMKSTWTKRYIRLTEKELSYYKSAEVINSYFLFTMSYYHALS